MTDIKLNADGDFWWENGILGIVRGNDAKLQELQLALEMGKGEWKWDTDAGIPYRVTTNSRDGNEALLEGSVRATCRDVLGQESVLAVEFIRDPETRHLTINVDTVYGRVTVTQ